MKSSGIGLIMLLFLFSCSDAGNKEKQGDGTTIISQYYETGVIRHEISVKGNVKEGITKNYNRQGKLIAEINYVNNMKDGITKNYYPGDGLHSTITYKQDKKEGKEVWYYENGKPYRITFFKDDKIDGIQKYFYENGTLMAELPYKKGFPGTGLKEYTAEGKLIMKYPTIVFHEINQIALTGKFILNISLSNGSKKVKFYNDNLVEGRYMRKYMIELQVRDGVSSLTYNIPRGYVKMEKLNFVAKYTTKLGLPYITQKTYNLALKH